MRNTISPETREKVIEMHKEGYSYAYIGEKLQIGHTTANNIGRKYYSLLDPEKAKEQSKNQTKDIVTDPENSNSNEFIDGYNKGKKQSTVAFIKELFSILEKSDYTCPLTTEPNVLVFQTLKKTVLKTLEQHEKTCNKTSKTIHAA